MTLVWNGPGPAPCFFPPDRAENVRGNAPEGYAWIVETALGEPVCGWRPDEPSGLFLYRLRPEWVLA